MADSYNTSDSPKTPVPTYRSPKPGDHRHVPWPEYLGLMGETIAVLVPGEHGQFIGNYMLGLSKQARLIGAKSPADHLAKAEAAADYQASYIASLEQAVEHGGSWALGPPDAADLDMGDYGGHPDEATLQAHIAIDPESETWRN